MSRVDPNQSLPRRASQIPPKVKELNVLLNEEGINVDEVLIMLQGLISIVNEDVPNNIVLFLEPDKKDRLVERLKEALDIPQDSVIRQDISKVNQATSVTNIILKQKDAINVASGENILVAIEGYENHLLDTLGLDLTLNTRQSHDFLQGPSNNMAEGLKANGINKRVTTLTILDVTHKQSVKLHFAFKESRFKNYIACVNL